MVDLVDEIGQKTGAVLFCGARQHKASQSFPENMGWGQGFEHICTIYVHPPSPAFVHSFQLRLPPSPSPEKHKPTGFSCVQSDSRHNPHLENNPVSEHRSCGGGDDDGPGSAAGVDVEGSSAQARICCRTCRPLLRLREDSPEMPTGTKRNTIHAVQRNAMDAKRDKLKTGLVLANIT